MKFLTILVMTAWINGCGGESSRGDIPEPRFDSSSADLGQNGLVMAEATGNLESSEQEVDILRDQLEAAEQLSEQERAALEKKLAEAEAKREEALREIEELQAAQQELEAKQMALEEELKRAGQNAIGVRIFHEQDCIDISGGWTWDNINAIAYPCHSDDNQRFQFEYVNDTDFRLIAKHSGKCLFVEGASNQVEANIHQKTCARDGNQYEIFTFIHRQGDEAKIQSKGSQKCFKVQSNNNLSQNDCNNIFTVFKIAP
ncbi:RICIN domain-containing protein [Pseudobacteriovorax antillogorgiicola]|uniref:Ricin-type beta-trefoil lectin domain-containing protein n=1 Tax=Pseudobacteriovorax antillogorgiicola TaxID=1513793 RepID=A0A1Y6BJA6_9BACT|nr:RICIN domain-containing protein [Pseudobacteriovorax antillogorgiicola]TCS55328.1 ricin-type beta-trefoil lectin protein [Pseudobacteriovorax antillogorgiicola]SMF14142.1 Ricin-type beta-trefoil lectin domain-containing protein [Pseudobacteriovorax antillogorgiicola]